MPANQVGQSQNILLGQYFYGSLWHAHLQADERVVYSKYAGTEIEVEGKEHILLKVCEHAQQHVELLYRLHACTLSSMHEGKGRTLLQVGMRA